MVPDLDGVRLAFLTPGLVPAGGNRKEVFYDHRILQVVAGFAVDRRCGGEHSAVFATGDMPV